MKRDYSPRRAWLFGCLYFTVCLVIAVVSGVLHRVFAEPLVSSSRLSDGVWIGATALVTAHVSFGYLYFWPRGTTAHGRPRHPGALVFGIAWGIAQAMLVLSLFEWLDRITGVRWLSASLTIAGWSMFAGLWQSRFWDVHVAPDHNIREWNLRKVLVVHVPFLVLSVAHFAAYGNAAVFVAWWVLALAASAWAMRFPAPWHPPTPGHDGRGIPAADVA